LAGRTCCLALTTSFGTFTFISMPTLTEPVSTSNAGGCPLAVTLLGGLHYPWT
jgi:hypothetical protein